MSFIESVITIMLTNARHKRYQREMQQAKINRTRVPVLGTQIRSTPVEDPDYSQSFRDW